MVIAQMAKGYEFETGTFTPSEETHRPRISFAKQHSTYPTIVVLEDSTGSIAPANSMIFYMVAISYDLLDVTIPITATATFYGRADSVAMNDAGTATSIAGLNILSTGSGYQGIGYYVDSSGFYASANGGTATKYRTDRTYKWIAIWV